MQLSKVSLSDISLSRAEVFCDRLVYILTLALLFGCTVLGPSRFIVIAGITPRMVIWCGIVLFSLPLVYRNRKNFIKNPLIIVWCLFFVYMALCAYLGYIGGNQRNVLFSDVKGFLYFLMLPAFLCVYRDGKRIETAMKVVVFGSAVFALLICGIELIHNLNPSFFQWLAKINDYDFLLLNYVSPQILRLFSPSTPYMVVSLCFCAYFQSKHGKIKWYYSVISALCLLAILLAFTRSVFLAALISLFLSALFALIAGYGRIFGKHLLLSVAIAGVLLAGAYGAFGANYLGFAYDRTSGETPVTMENEPQDGNNNQSENPGAGNNQNQGELDANILEKIDDPGAYIDTSKGSNDQIDAYLNYSKQVSDYYRQYTISAMTAKIKASPIFGNGLGTTIKYRDYNEYFYLDILMKMGVVGLLLYILPAFLCGYWYFSKIRFLGRKSPCREQMLQVGSVVAGFLGICIFSFFNPYLNAVLGETMYSFGIAAVFLLRDHADRFLKADQ